MKTMRSSDSSQKEFTMLGTSTQGISEANKVLLVASVPRAHGIFSTKPDFVQQVKNRRKGTTKRWKAIPF